jgi:signal transduction histidine kinase
VRFRGHAWWLMRTERDRTLAGLGWLGLLVGAGSVWVASRSGYEAPQEPSDVLALLVGWSFIGSGLLAWRARPENRLGLVMVLTGFMWFASMLRNARQPVLFTIGEAVWVLYLAGFLYLILAFPSGRLQGALGRGLVAVTLALITIVHSVALLFADSHAVICARCASNLLEVARDDALALGLFNLVKVVGIGVIAAAFALLAARWRRATRLQRRAVTPVLLADGASLAAVVAVAVGNLAGSQSQVLSNVAYYAFAAVPVAVMFVLVQRRLARGAVAALVAGLGGPDQGPDLREALARALGDSSLELAYWFPAEARYVDGDGRPVAAPDADPDRLATVVERGGQPVAMLVHDPVLHDNKELVESVCAAARLALENERLQAESRARLAELHASRARLVEATAAERRRIERDLHDGTQQRLVSIAMSLGLLESKLPAGAHELVPIVRETRAALSAALEELRELTQGIHPTILAERGLPAALEELCQRAVLPADVRVALDGRLPEQVESAAYFVVSEALTNAAKHSHASEVRVAASTDGQALTVQVADDGIGGAAPGPGTGLRGLADRVEALGGRLIVSSPPGQGTSLRAEIPCG